MLIFDCTQDAADFFSKKVKGKIISAVQPGVRGEIPPQAELQRHVDLWEESFQPVYFFKRSDRSVQAHINSVLDMAARREYVGPGLPIGEQDLIEFDGVANQFYRSIRGSDYIIPAELELKQVYPRLGMVMTEVEMAEAYEKWNASR